MLSINNKKYCDLIPPLKDLIKHIFYNFDKNEIIKCWRNHYDQKADIFIKIGPVLKGISIKMGSKNSVHVEHINKFISFLKENGLTQDIVDIYLRYHFADGTKDNTGTTRLSAAQYKNTNKEMLVLFNKKVNSQKIIVNAIDRFVLRGNNSKYPIDALIYGTPNDFLWITRSDIFKILLSRENTDCITPHFGNLIIQSKNRCLNHNVKYETDRYYVQVKWYSIFDDILISMNNKFINKVNSNADNVIQ